MYTQNESGFTLVELIITVVIIGIISAIAVPSMQRSFSDYRMKKGANAIAAALVSARAQALNHNSVKVTVDSSFKRWQASYSETTTGKTTQVADVDVNSNLAVNGSSIPSSRNFQYFHSGRTSLSSNVDISICDTGSGVTNYVVTIFKSGSVEVNRGSASC